METQPKKQQLEIVTRLDTAGGGGEEVGGGTGNPPRADRSVVTSGDGDPMQQLCLEGARRYEVHMPEHEQLYIPVAEPDCFATG